VLEAKPKIKKFSENFFIFVTKKKSSPPKKTDLDFFFRKWRELAKMT